MFILTIYFIVLNVYVEFVLIYRPHPVYLGYLGQKLSKSMDTGPFLQKFLEMYCWIHSKKNAHVSLASEWQKMPLTDNNEHLLTTAL